MTNVASADETDEAFTYDCKRNEVLYTCELYTAVYDIFLSIEATQKIGLNIQSHEETVLSKMACLCHMLKR